MIGTLVLGPAVLAGAVTDQLSTKPDVDFLAIAPVLALGGAAVLVVLLRAILRRHAAAVPIATVVSLLGVVGAAVLLWFQWDEVSDDGPFTTFSTTRLRNIPGMVVVDGFAVFLGVVIVAATLMALLLAISYLRREQLEAPEYLALVLLSGAGMLAMTTANDLVVVFLALEILSIPLYVLAAFDRRRLRSQEAGIKYFVLGAFSSAIFLYGIALTYGATGATNLFGISLRLSQGMDAQGTLLAGIALLLVGLGFKVSAVPFHQWTPDVYQGAPTPVTAFMASATKAAGFAALLRVFITAFPLFREDWRPLVEVLAILTLVVGTVAAVIQTDIKRMLAYSSIANAGYVLIGFAAASVKDKGAQAIGLQSALLYLFVYAFMTIGAFAVIGLAGRRGDDRHSLDDYRGLALTRPVLGGLLAFFVLAQAGVPLTGGFVIKLEVFSAAADAGLYELLVVGVFAAVVAAFIYLRITVALFQAPFAVDDPHYQPPRAVDVWSGLVLVAAATVTIVAGLVPGGLIDFAKDATLFLA